MAPRHPANASRGTPANHTTDVLTHVELTWRAGQSEHRVRFGHPVARVRLGRDRRRISFAAGSIFAVIRWEANEFGTVLSRADILRAVGAGEHCTTVPMVEPGVAILLTLFGWPKVERVLQAIDDVEQLGINPADAAPEHWHHVHNRLTVNEAPRRYSHTRHQAWIKRRRITP